MNHIALKTLTEACDLPAKISLLTAADPLLNIDNNTRVTLTIDRKQCGTIVPMVLYMAMKLRVIISQGLTEEPAEGVDKIVQSSLRQTLMEIRRASQETSRNVYYGKTLQEKMFKHLVFNEPLSLISTSDLLFDESKNKAHTVSNGTVQGENPSFTVPCYLCRFLLEKEGLHPDTEFVKINPTLKRYAKGTFAKLKPFPKTQWENQATFSRRVQNEMTVDVLRKAFSEEELNYLMKHPYY